MRLNDDVCIIDVYDAIYRDEIVYGLRGGIIIDYYQILSISLSEQSVPVTGAITVVVSPHTCFDKGAKHVSGT